MKPTCIDLHARYGDRYKIAYDPSYEAERPEFRSSEKPWLQIIPCRNGQILPWGPADKDDPHKPGAHQWLAASTKGAGTVAKRLKALQFTKLVQDGSDGATVLFPPDHFDEVAEIMVPRRRRRLSPEARRAAGERLAKYRFQTAVESPPDERPCVPSPLPDPETPAGPAVVIRALRAPKKTGAPSGDRINAPRLRSRGDHTT